jgi:hypothetical protein
MIRNPLTRTVQIPQLALGIARRKNHFSIQGTAPTVPGTARSAMMISQPLETQANAELELPLR